MLSNDNVVLRLIIKILVTEKNITIEMASYLSTMFDPSLAYKLKQTGSKNFPPQHLENDLASHLKIYLNVTLPELLSSVAIK